VDGGSYALLMKSRQDGVEPVWADSGLLAVNRRKTDRWVSVRHRRNTSTTLLAVCYLPLRGLLPRLLCCGPDDVFFNEFSTTTTATLTVASARICCEEGQRWKLGHGALTANFRAGCSSCSMTNSFVTDAVLIERGCELLTSAPADLADYTIFG